MTGNDLRPIGAKRSKAFWVIIVFMAISVPLLILGQTIAVFNYEFTANIGLQEDVTEVSPFGVEVNRAFGASDTIIYIPLIVLSIIGLCLKKQWALFTSAAVMGISLYWTTTVAFILQFLIGLPNYSYIPSIDIWVFIGSFMAFGLWGLWYLINRGERLINQT
jgi:hypothetical protein